MTKEEILQEFSDINNVYNNCTRYDTLKRMLDELTEQKTGHWIYDNFNWRCSECNETPKTLGYVGTADFMSEHFRFCNHCGIRMVESQENPITIDEITTQIANTMNLSKAEVRADIDRIFDMSQPIRGVFGCLDWDELIRKGDKETESQEREDEK